MNTTLTATTDIRIAATSTTPAKTVTTYGTGTLAFATTRTDGSLTIRRMPNTLDNRKLAQSIADQLVTAPSITQVKVFIGNGRTGEPLAYAHAA